MLCLLLLAAGLRGVAANKTKFYKLRRNVNFKQLTGSGTKFAAPFDAVVVSTLEIIEIIGYPGSITPEINLHTGEYPPGLATQSTRATSIILER